MTLFNHAFLWLYVVPVAIVALFNLFFYEEIFERQRDKREDSSSGFTTFRHNVVLFMMTVFPGYNLLVAIACIGIVIGKISKS